MPSIWWRLQPSLQQLSPRYHPMLARRRRPRERVLGSSK
jgi:hypothetical protein